MRPWPLALAEEHHDTHLQAQVHRTLAWAGGQRHDYRLALHHAKRTLDLYRGLGQPVWEADALNMIGWHSAQVGEYDTARDHCQAALAMHRLHHAEGEAATLDSLGYIEHHSGRHRPAIDYYQQALALYRGFGNTVQCANTLDNLGHPHVSLGESEKARVVWQEALRLYQDQGRATDIARVRQQLDELNTTDVRPT